MAKYELKFATSVKKELQKIPNDDVTKILRLIKSLLDNPYPKNVKKLSHKEKYRIRYRKYLILYLIENEILTIYIIKISHRKDVYKC